MEPFLNSGGAFRPQIVKVGALSAPTLWFLGRFLPPFARFGGDFCPHSLDSPIQLSLSPLHLHPTSHFLLSQHHLPTIHLFQAVYPLNPVHLSQNPQLPLHNPFLLQPCFGYAVAHNPDCNNLRNPRFSVQSTSVGICPAW